MHPEIFRIGPLHVNSYGLMIAIGFLLSLFFLVRRARLRGMKPMDVFDTAIFVLLCGIVGARLLHVILYWNSEFVPAWHALKQMEQAGEISSMGKYVKFFVKLVAVWEAGLAFFGGFLGAVGGLAYNVHKRGLPLRPTLDVFASVLPLGHAFGRVGCFLAGCCYGKVTDTIHGTCFPPGSPAYGRHYPQITANTPANVAPVESLPVHPTQLYAAGYNLLIFGLLTWVFYRRRRAGDVAWAYASYYGVARFVNEFFRADTEPWLGGLTIFQYAAGGVAVFGAFMLIRSYRKEPEPIPEPWEPEDEQREDAPDGQPSDKGN